MSASLMTIEEYFTKEFEVAHDFVDGEVQECCWEPMHGAAKMILFSRFYLPGRGLAVTPLINVGLQVSASRYRIADVCIMPSPGDPTKSVLAPLICIEVLSPEDRMQRVLERVRDFHNMGVENVWILNPFTRDAWIAQPDGSQQHVSDALSVEGTPIRIELAEVWAELDDMQS